ncbi:hypothetical protein GWN75_21540 [candidate division KSB1 bacterium]|nr:hypothetical protein [candidate division KSB1 bacterium]NIR71629.1 hypothetical protein [candidate division KSB1 bacterium]NIS26366.1 hypothetical protein [candidate division KSB1 bacterium]NIU27049.1 hypothetical protein [candidate division KSB1 bacterium]NIU92867.1 hypothetical protein [candidate division KSB1 bacterium]
MKKHTRKEFGKLLFDIAKIFLAVGVVAPFFSSELLSYRSLSISTSIVILLIIIGLFLIERGANDE